MKWTASPRSGVITGQVRVLNPAKLTTTAPRQAVALIGVDSSGRPLVDRPLFGQPFAMADTADGSCTLLDTHLTTGDTNVQAGRFGRVHQARVYTVARDGTVTLTVRRYQRCGRLTFARSR